jgi:hypothetical protein
VASGHHEETSEDGQSAREERQAKGPIESRAVEGDKISPARLRAQLAPCVSQHQGLIVLCDKLRVSFKSKQTDYKHAARESRQSSISEKLLAFCAA